MKRIFCFYIMLMTGVSLSFAGASDRPLRETGKEAGLILDLQKVSLGTLANVEQRRQYMSTVQLEKQRIQNFTLNVVYDNAYKIYRQGDYQRAAEMSDVILSIDPSMKKAQTLSDTATKMATYGTLSENEILDMKYNEAIGLYKQGRLVEAQAKFEEILTLDPNENDAKNWIKRIDNEFSKIHTRRGYYAYKQGDYQEALNQWYNVLLIKKEDPALTAKIAEVESMLKKEESDKAIEKAFDYYSKGRLIAAYEEFNKAQEFAPGEKQTQKFIAQLKEEIATNYYNAGNKAYNERRYDNAITNWKEAEKWGYKKSDISRLVRKAEDAQVNPPPIEEPKKAKSKLLNPQDEFRNAEPLDLEDKPLPLVKTKKLKKVPLYEPKKAPKSNKVPKAKKVTPKKEVKAEPKKQETPVTKTPEVKTPEVKTPEKTPTGSSLPVAQKAPEPVTTPSTATAPAANPPAKKQETEPDNKAKPETDKETKPKEEQPKEEEVSTEVDDDGYPTQEMLKKNPVRVTESARQESIKHYRYGLAAFSEGNYEKAKEEWQAALSLNPENSDAALGLKRVEEKYSNR